MHFQQIREAVARPQPNRGPGERRESESDEHRGSNGPGRNTEGVDGYDKGQDPYLPLVVRTFMGGFPHQYRAPAPVGTTIGLEIDGVGLWTLTRSDHDTWDLDEGRPADPAATL